VQYHCFYSDGFQKRHLTKLHLTLGILPDLQAFFWLRVFFSQALSRPSRQQVTPAFETIEKVLK
jgi:hypothetical protein